MSYAYSEFQKVSGSPKPFEINSIFRGSGADYSYNSNTSQLLEQLINQVNDQTAVVNNLVGAITGQSNGSALQSILGGTSFGGSALGGIASAAQSGFSWQSVVSDIFPIGGLISGIASLFDSAPTPPPLDQYAAPPSLNFDAVLNSNGTLSQGSTNQFGFTQASSPGLSLEDAEGGPYSPYQRASNGSLVPAAGNPVSLYNGTLNLPDLVQNLVQIGPAPTASPSPAQAQSTISGGSSNALGDPANLSTALQNLIQAPTEGTSAPASSYSSVTNTSPAASSVPSAPGLSSTGNSPTSDPTNPVPSFDQQWFNDHGSMIASAVRTELLNYHPLVDAINDL